MEEDYKNPRFNSYNDMADSVLYDLTTLYVKNIPIDLTNETFVSLMSENGRKIKRQRLFEPRKDFTTKIGLISFTSEAEAQDALDCLNKKPPYRFQIQYALNKSKEIKNYLNPWWSIECQEALELRTKAWNRYHHKPLAEYRDEHAKADRNFRKVRRKCMREYENSIHPIETNKDTNTMPNEGFGQTKKLSFGRGVGLDNKVLTQTNLRVVVDGEKRTAFRKSPEKSDAEVKSIPRLLPYPFPLCLRCKKQAKNMCGICRQFYCSRECQEEDWPKHKEICQPANLMLPKNNTLPKNNSFLKSSSSKGADSSYMSDSSDAERNSECGEISQRNISHSRDPSSGRRTPNYNGVSLSRESSKFQKVETVINISDLKETTLPDKAEVRVCSINSPSCFWVQLEEAKDVLQEMEKSMSSANLRKASCSVNDVCCVNHESKYCRVQIMKALPSSSFLVRFIDSGGTGTFPSNKIYQLPEWFKKYPTQAICCNLVDSPTDKSVQWNMEQSSSFKSYALNKVFNVNVHGCSNTIHNVSLFDKEGFSAFSVISLEYDIPEPDQIPEPNSANKCSDIPTVWTNMKNSMNISIVPFEIQDNMFYGMVINEESTQAVAAMEEELQKTMQNKENISFRSKEGDIAVASSVQYGLFRCVVLNKLKSSFLVHAIDYGNRDEISVLYELPSNLLQKTTFGVCCEKPNSFSSEEFKKRFPLQKTVSCSVKSINNSCKILEIQNGSDIVLKCFPWYHGLFEKSSISPQIPSKPLLPLPKKLMKGAIADKKVCPGDKYKVKVVYFKTSSEVFVQFETDESDIIKLSQNLHKFCNLPSNNFKKYVPDIDEMVACKFSEDGNWYRGQVLKKSKNSFRVLFIDYGNESDVSDIDIKPLSEDFLYPKLGLSVSLHGVRNEDLTRDLLTKLCNEVWVMDVKAQSDDSVQVMLFQGQKSLVDFLTKKNLGSLLTFQKLPSKEPVDIQITHADSNHIYVQMEKDLKQIENLTEKLNSVEKKAVSSKILPNHIYCGLFSDGLWYRVSIESELGLNKFMVNFIDFGNKDEILLKDLRECPQELFDSPVYCVKVSAQNVDTSSSLQLQKTYSVMVVGEKNGVQEIKFCTGSDRLPKVSTLKKQAFDVGNELELSLCYIEGDIYYSHMKSALKLRESLESDLCKACDFVGIDSVPEVGDVLCAKCSDGVWYRGAVEEICSADSCKISFIDFGNAERVSLQDMKVLPPSLCSYPIFSIPLKVNNVKVLQEQLSDENSFFRVKVLDVKENVTVEVLKPNNVSKPDIKPQVLPSTPVDVVVCFKEKERYFVQKYCDLDKISKMTSEFHSSNLQAISGAPQNGDVFCVKYEELFYRGLVKKVLGNKRYHIYFIDYGNTDIVNMSDMFALPSNYSTQPMFCIPVQLDKASLSNPLEMDCRYSVKYTGKMNGDSHIVSIGSPVSPILWNSLKEPLLEDSAEVSFLSYDNGYHYVRKSSDIEEYKRMENVLDGLICDKIVHVPSINEVFLIKCEDQKLHRGYITDCNEALGQYVVNLFDLGKSENVSACNLHYIPLKVRTFPNFTVKVKVSSTSSPVTLGNSYNIKIIKTDAGIPVLSVIQSFLFKNIEHQCLPEGEVRVVIFYHKECDTLYLQDNSNIEKIAEILTEVNNNMTSSALTHSPVEGELVSARSALDDIWYRASVTQVVSNDKFKVLFIDYGNSEVVSKESLKPFSGKLMSYPSQAIAVKVVHPVNSDVVLEKQYEVMALSKPVDGIQNVKIQLGNNSEPTRLPSENPRSDKFYFRNCKYVPFPSGEYEVAVYYVESANHFYGAPNDDYVIQNYKLTSEITKYCQGLGVDQFDGDSEPEIGELVLTKYEGDWFRAVVVVKSLPFFEVTFLDYGNSQRVHIKECRKMVDQFMNYPIFSHKCLFSGFAISQGKEADVAAELKGLENDIKKAVVKIDGGNKKIYFPSKIDLLVEKKLAVRQD